MSPIIALIIMSSITAGLPCLQSRRYRHFLLLRIMHSVCANQTGDDRALNSLLFFWIMTL